MFLDRQIAEGNLKPDPETLEDTKITYHDPCYLGRANEMYDEPRSIIGSLTEGFVEMHRNRSFALCCGAGGAQMFKEAEKGDKEVFIERTEDALSTGAGIIATACPFCMTMLTDGIKYKNREDTVKNLDIAELIARSLKI
jgi:Fe-S oxidoreductase